MGCFVSKCHAAFLGGVNFKMACIFDGLVCLFNIPKRRLNYFMSKKAHEVKLLFQNEWVQISGFSVCWMRWIQCNGDPVKNTTWTVIMDHFKCLLEILYTLDIHCILTSFIQSYITQLYIFHNINLWNVC